MEKYLDLTLLGSGVQTLDQEFAAFVRPESLATVRNAEDASAKMENADTALTWIWRQYCAAMDVLLAPTVADKCKEKLFFVLRARICTLRAKLEERGLPS